MDYYVDNTVAAGGSGTSWTQAWNSFAAIDWAEIKPGDTIYISGGATSQTYNETLTVGASGSAAGNITIEAGTDPGHNGKVIIDGGNTLANGVAMYGENYVTINGLNVQNISDAGFSVKEATAGVVLENNSVYSGMGDGGNARGYDIRNNVGTDSVIVTNNSFTTPSNTPAQTDGIYSSGNDGVVFENNNIDITNSNTNGHSDDFQSYMDGNIIVRNNVFNQDNTATVNNHGAWMSDTLSGDVIQFYNNVVTAPNLTGDSVVTEEQESTSTGTAHFFNNTIIGGERAVNIYDTPNVEVQNNIIEPASGGYGVMIAGTLPPAANINNNLIYAPNGTIGYAGGSDTWAEWQAQGYDVNGVNANPDFTDAAAGNYTLASGSPAIGAGADISSITTDNTGAARVGSTYDIGALQTASIDDGSGSTGSGSTGSGSTGSGSTGSGSTDSGSTGSGSTGGTDYYVDNTASAGGSGTSWSQAWNSFSAIDWAEIKPGDTIYISGGATSQTYNETLTVGASGSAAGNITIEAGTDPGHNGKVIIDGGNTLANGVAIYGQNYVTINGLNVQNISDAAFSVEKATAGVVIENNSAYSGMGNGGDARGYDIRDNVGTNSVIVTNNSFTTPSNTSSQTDGIYSSGNDGVVFENNNIDITNSNTNGHSDDFQSYMDGNIIVRNNVFDQDNTATVDNHGAWMSDTLTGDTIQFYNNVVTAPNLTANSVVTEWQESTSGQTGTADIYNNTIIGGERAVNIYTTSNAQVKNNIIEPAAGGYGIMITGTAPPAANINNNLIYAPNATVGYDGGSDTWAEWQAQGYDVNGVNANPDFTDAAAGNYTLASNSPAIGAGVDIPTITTDNTGAARVGSTYDIGALQTAAIDDGSGTGTGTTGTGTTGTGTTGTGTGTTGTGTTGTGTTGTGTTGTGTTGTGTTGTGTTGTGTTGTTGTGTTGTGTTGTGTTGTGTTGTGTTGTGTTGTGTTGTGTTGTGTTGTGTTGTGTTGTGTTGTGTTGTGTTGTGTTGTGTTGTGTTTGPTVTAVTTTPVYADLGVGQKVAITLTLSEAATVTGTPTLALNDGGVASYQSGSGTNALTFTYTVAAGQNTPALTVTGDSLPNGASIVDANGNGADLSGAGAGPLAGLIVDTTDTRTTIAYGNGQTVNAGTGNDVVTLSAGHARLVFHGSNDVAFLGGGTAAVNATISDRSTGLTIDVASAGNDVFKGFASDPTAVVDLLGGVGGYSTVSAVLAALTSDGHGGSKLALGAGHAIDFTGVAPSALEAANFKIG